MFHWLFKIAKRIFNIRDQFCLVLEQFDNHVEATYAKINNYSKKITLVRRKKLNNFSALKKPLAFLDRFVLALDPRHATTLESVVRLKRPKPQEIISEGELDHLVFRGLWEFLNRYRSWASKKMGVSDLDLVLAHIEIRDAALGSHRVFNPLGFKGGELTLKFRATFVPRGMTALIAKFRPWTDHFVVVENHSIVSLSIPEPSDFVVHLAETRTGVFASRPDERLYVRECFWGGENIVKAIATTFAVDEGVAHELINRYIEGGVSARVGRIIDSKVRGEFRILLEMLDSIYNTRKGYVIRPAMHFNIRSFVPHPEYLLETNRLKLVDFVSWSGREGYSFTSKDKKYFSTSIHQSIIALLQHPYSDSHYEFVNKLLKRRVRWLVG